MLRFQIQNQFSNSSRTLNHCVCNRSSTRSLQMTAKWKIYQQQKNRKMKINNNQEIVLFLFFCFLSCMAVYECVWSTAIWQAKKNEMKKKNYYSNWTPERLFFFCFFWLNFYFLCKWVFYTLNSTLNYCALIEPYSRLNASTHTHARTNTYRSTLAQAYYTQFVCISNCLVEQKTEMNERKKRKITKTAYCMFCCCLLCFTVFFFY